MSDPKMGPGAETAARFLFEHSPFEPDVVIVIFTKNVSANEARTGVGTASRLELTDERAAFILRKALKAVSP